MPHCIIGTGVIACCIHCSRTLDICARKCQIGHNFSFNLLLPTGVALGVARLSFRVAFATLCHPGRSAYVLVYAWVLSGYSDFLPPSKNMHVRLIDSSKLSCECELVWLFVSVWSCDGLGVPRLSTDDRWDRLRDPTDGLSGYRKWMNGCSYRTVKNISCKQK